MSYGSCQGRLEPIFTFSKAHFLMDLHQTVSPRGAPCWQLFEL